MGKCWPLLPCHNFVQCTFRAHTSLQAFYQTYWIAMPALGATHQELGPEPGPVAVSSTRSCKKKHWVTPFLMSDLPFTPRQFWTEIHPKINLRWNGRGEEGGRRAEAWRDSHFMCEVKAPQEDLCGGSAGNVLVSSSPAKGNGSPHPGDPWLLL